VPYEQEPRRRRTPNDAGPTDPRDAADAAWQAREDVRAKYHVRHWTEVIEDAPPEPWLDDLIYGGSITIVAGEANAGKGWFALAVAACIATGSPFLTNAAPVPRSVLYVNPERDPLGQRFRAAAARYPLVSHMPFVTWAPGEPFTGMVQTFRELLEELKRNKEAAEFNPANCLLILDPLRPLLAGNENDSTELALFFTQLRQVIGPFGPLPGAAALVIHHTGWQDTQLSVARERGSSDIRAAADVTLVLRNVRQLLAHQKRKLAQQRGRAAVLAIDTSIPELLLLERHKHRLVHRRQDASVLELEPQAVIEPDGRIGNAAWMVRSLVTEEEVEAMFEAGKAAAREATENADCRLVTGALQRTGQPMSVTELRLATELPEKRVQGAVRLLLARKQLRRDKSNGPVRLADDDGDWRGTGG
jgi:RecA-family ATPase